MAKSTQISGAKNEFSFNVGWLQLRQLDCEPAKNELMEALRINNSQSWRDRRYGRREPKISEVQAIESVFSKYGITQIWGL